MSKCPNCKERDFRCALVFVIVLLTFGIGYIKLLTGNTDDTLVPPWAAGLSAAAVSMYFMSRSGERMREMTREIFEKGKQSKNTALSPPQ